ARRAGLRRALPAGRVAAPVALIDARARLGHVVLVAHARAVAARRRAGVAVGVRARHAVVLERVVLHAHPELGIGRADLAARDRADVAVRVRARRAHLRRTFAAGRVAAAVALIRGRTRLAHVVLVAHARAGTASRRAGVAVAVRARRAVARERVRLHAHPQLGIARADLAARERAHVAVRVRARRARLRRALATGRIAAPVALIDGRTRLAHVVLVAHARAVAARRRAGVAVVLGARPIFARERVRLHAHPQLGIGRADLAARERAHVAVRVRARRARLRRALPAGRVAAPVALIGARTRLAHVLLVAHARAVAARRRARVAVGVGARRAVARERVGLYAHAEVGIGRADLAARDRAHGAVRVRARRAGLLRRARP